MNHRILITITIRTSGIILGSIFFLLPLFLALFFLAPLPSVLVAHASVINKSASTTASGLTNTDLNNGLVGYWPFDGKDMTWTSGTAGTVNDVSGNGNTGTLTNMNEKTSIVEGKIGQALQFNGTSQYVVSQSNSSITGDPDYTISVWAYIPNPITIGAGEYPAMVWWGTEGYGEGVIFGISNVDPTHIFVGYWGCGMDSVGTIPDNQWVHFIWVRHGQGGAADGDQSGNTLYVNGVSVPLMADPTFSDCYVNIGSGPYQFADTGSNYSLANYKLNNVRVYNRALSATEVKQLYNYGLTTIDNTNVNLTNSDLSPGSASGLTAYYPFSGQYITWSSATVGTSTDATGNGYNGTLKNMNRATSVVTSRSGQALKFNGATSYVQGTTSLIATGATTVCAWIKQSSFVSTANAIVANMKFIFYTSSTNNTLGLTSDGSTDAVSATNAIVNGVWQFVCGTRNASGVANLYVNASSTGAANQTSGTPAVSTFPVDIGVAGNHISDFFGGAITDVRIYSRVLSATEISQLYDETKGDVVNKSPQAGGLTNTDLTSASSTSGGNPSGLVGYWPFDGKYMTWSSATVGTSTDASGNGNDGTLINMNRTTSVVPGKIGQALSFNGTSQVNIGSSPSLTGPITISVWIHMNQSSYTGNTTVIVGPISIYISGSLILAYGTIGGNTSNWGNNTNGQDITTWKNKWVYYVFTYDGSTAGEYINGVRQNRNSASGSITFYPWNFGYNSSFPSVKSWNGSLDDVRIYNRALSATEVQQLYDMGR